VRIAFVPSSSSGGGGGVVGITDVTGTEPIVVTSPSSDTRNVAINDGIPGEYTSFPGGVMANYARRRIGYTCAPATGGGVASYGQATVLTGSQTHPGQVATSFYTCAGKNRYTSTAAINVRTGLCFTQNEVFRGNVANTGGFIFEGVFGFETITATSRFFFGLQSSGTLVTLATDPSNLTDVVGIGFDSADANLQWMHNDAAGTCTKVDLGATFPKPSGAALSRDVYQLIMVCAPNVGGTSQSVAVFLMRRDDETVVPDTRTLSTDLPTATVALSGHIAFGTGPSSAVAVVGSFMRMQTETVL
jgi:hypothetical protein